MFLMRRDPGVCGSGDNVGVWLLLAATLDNRHRFCDGSVCAMLYSCGGVRVTRDRR